MTIKIVITDDHPMVLKGLKNMLALYNDIEILAAYHDAKQLLEGLITIKPDIILLDLMMPEMNGDEAHKRINKQYPELKVIILSNHGNAIYVNNLINLGVAGYLSKTVDEDTLYQAIHKVMDGAQFIEPELQDKVDKLNEGINRSVTLKFRLTAREKEVLQLIVDGHSTSEIAQMLFLSGHTIHTYRDNLMLKLDANNSATLVKLAIQMGLVPI